MSLKANEIKVIKKLNEEIYRDLNEILKKLNKKFNLKFYAAIFDENGDFKDSIRVKRTISQMGNAANNKGYEVNQEKLSEMNLIFDELKIDKYFEESEKIDRIKKYLNERAFVEDIEVLDEAIEMNIEKSKKNFEDKVIKIENMRNDLIYANEFKLSISSKKFTILYILEIRNVDEETRNIFYNTPIISFLRTTLEYYFKDYYLEENEELNFELEINKKYNEDNISFTRRMSRLFFGQIQNILSEKEIRIESLKEDKDKIQNSYCTSSLIEEIDDISAKTYEGASPFGSILLGNKEYLEDNKKIKYAVKFKQGIKLEDSKRIRKLLEITNKEKDLYLISDGKSILGLGELIWSKINGCMLFRIDFKGILKYDLVCVHTRETECDEGEVIIKEDKKMYKCNLEIVENRIVSILFKNPKVKEEEYTPERFKRVIKSEFFNEEEEKEDQIKKIEQIVRKSREQKHGTIVVITDYETAQIELELLEKQSTIIEAGKIDSEYIQYLTSIDGAIYLDTKGNCHAIGVILDGIASHAIGDASRGARYNSAYRYLNKLKEQEKKCVIAIISEDGMVDIIPEIKDEEKAIALVEEIIDLINKKEKELKEKELKEKEEEFKSYKFIDYKLYFEIAKVFQNNKKYKEAIEYYEEGVNRAKEEKSFIISDDYNWIATCYHSGNRYKEAIENYEKAIELDKNQIVYYKNLANSYHNLGKEKYKSKQYKNSKEFFEKSIDTYTYCIDRESENNADSFNRRGLNYNYIYLLEKNESYAKKEIKDYSSAIKLKPSEKVYYRNRGMSYRDVKENDKSLNDFIKVISLSGDDEKYTEETINMIREVLDENNNLIKNALEYYDIHGFENEKLKNVLEEYNKKLEVSKTEATAEDSQD